MNSTANRMPEIINENMRLQIQQPMLQSISNFNSAADNLAKKIIGANSMESHDEGSVVIRRYVAVGIAATLIGLLVPYIGGVALYSLGSVMNKLKDANRELEDTCSFQRMMDSNRMYADTKEQRDLLFAADRVVELKGRICQRVKDSAAWERDLRIGMASSCAFVLGGYIFSIPAAITAGTVACVAIGGGMLFKWGLDSSDTDNLRDAQALAGATQNLNAMLQKGS